MNEKTWIKLSLFLSLLIISGVGLINLIIDPLWLNSHSHALNTHQRGFNERLQKSIYLKNRVDLKKIDSMLFGSSRVTYYNVSSVKTKYKIFNYGFSGGVPNEFIDYLEYAKRLKGDHFDLILLGLDFIGPAVINKKPETFTDRVLSDVDRPFELYKQNLTVDMLKFSIINIKNSFIKKAGYRSYSRDLEVVTSHDPEKTVESYAKIQMEGPFYRNLDFKDSYYEDLKTLIRQNPKSKFIVFTTPLSSVFLDRIHGDEQLSKEYRRWITESLAIFKELHLFTFYNQYARDYRSLSKDGGHYYPEIGQQILDTLLNQTKNPNMLLLTPQNFSEVQKTIFNPVGVDPF